MCRMRRRGGRKNWPPNHLHHQHLPLRVHAYCVRQLLQGSGGGRGPGDAQPLGHGGPGGVRQAADPLLSRHRRVHPLLLAGVPQQPRQRAGRLDAGAHPPRPARPQAAGGLQVGSQTRQEVSRDSSFRS